MAIVWEDMKSTEAKAPEPSLAPINPNIVWEDMPEKKPAKNTTLDNVAAYGQIAAESVSAGFLGDEVVAGVHTGMDYLSTLFADEGFNKKQGISDMYDMYYKEATERESQFREENPALSIGTDIAGGLGTGFAVAGKLGNAATRGANVLRQGGAAGAEAAIHGFMEGESLEERLDNSLLYGTLGTAIGGAGGGLMRGQKSIDEIAKAREVSRLETASDDVRSIAGKEGYVSKEAVKKKSGFIASLLDRGTKSIQDQGGELVSPRFGHLVNKADGIHMREIAETVDLVENAGSGMNKLDKFFKTDIGSKIATEIANAGAKDKKGRSLPPAIRARILDMAGEQISKYHPDLGKTWNAMRTKTDELAKRDIGNEATGGFFPRRANAKLNAEDNAIRDLGGKGLTTSRTSASNIDSSMPVLTTGSMLKGYRTPVGAFMDYMEDVVSIDALVKSFDLSIDPSTVGDSSIKAVVREVKDKMAKEGAKDTHLDSAGKLLDSFATSSKIGPNAFMQVMRTATSAALLGKPENAVLQIGDLGGAAFQSGFYNAVKSLPRAIGGLFTHTDKIVDNKGKMFKAPDLGISRQFLGEIKREGEGSFTKMLDFGAEKIMSGFGIRKVNKLGQEVSINAAYKRAVSIAERSPEKLGELKSTRGYTTDELTQLSDDLISGEQTDLVKSYLFTTLTDMQPVSASALPQAYADYPNGRIIYSMKTYMLKHMNIMRTDIAGTMVEAEKLGLGTKEGQKLFRHSLKQSARYVAMVAGLNGYVDDKRKIPRTGEDNYEPIKSTASQLVSNATSGFVDIRADERGGSIAGGLVPPAYKAIGAFGDGALGLAMDQDPKKMQKFFTTFMPVASQANWFKQMSE